jgi:hypothetical protein
MKDSSKRVSQVVEKLRQLENILKHTTLLKLPKRRKSYRDMVMSSMERSENARKK